MPIGFSSSQARLTRSQPSSTSICCRSNRNRNHKSLNNARHTSGLRPDGDQPADRRRYPGGQPRGGQRRPKDAGHLGPAALPSGRRHDGPPGHHPHQRPAALHRRPASPPSPPPPARRGSRPPALPQLAPNHNVLAPQPLSSYSASVSASASTLLPLFNMTIAQEDHCFATEQFLLCPVPDCLYDQQPPLTSTALLEDHLQEAHGGGVHLCLASSICFNHLPLFANQ